MYVDGEALGFADNSNPVINRLQGDSIVHSGEGPTHAAGDLAGQNPSGIPPCGLTSDTDEELLPDIPTPSAVFSAAAACQTTRPNHRGVASQTEPEDKLSHELTRRYVQLESTIAALSGK